jgi:radical SAM protein with 4Fe4S-binding SPASM domain
MGHWSWPVRYANKRLVQIQERFFRNQRVFGLPFAIALESGNSCNLRCPLCPTTFREKEIPRGTLSLDSAKKIIGQFPALLDLNLAIWGEPLLNKEIFDIIKYARSKKIDVLIQSNFSLTHFDEAMAQELIDSDLNRLQLSIDGASQKTYEVYRRRGDFETVIHNIELLRRLQVEQKKSRPQITWKFVVNKHNEHEVRKAEERTKQLGVEFIVVEIYVPEHIKNEWKPAQDVTTMGLLVHQDILEKCYSLWQFMSVNFNGDVFPCCSEWSPKDAIGNVLRQPLKEIWNGAEYRRLRAGNKNGPPDCETCHKDKGTNFWRQHSLGEQNPAMLPLLRPDDAGGGPDSDGNALPS